MSAVYDPVTGAGIVVLVDENPEYTPATFTGMLRRDERDVSDAKTTEGFDFSTLGLDVSDIVPARRRQRADERTPGLRYRRSSSACSRATILIGLAGGYLVYRKSVGRAARAGDHHGGRRALPVRVTGRPARGERPDPRPRSGGGPRPLPDGRGPAAADAVTPGPASAAAPRPRTRPVGPTSRRPSWTRHRPRWSSPAHPPRVTRTSR